MTDILHPIELLNLTAPNAVQDWAEVTRIAESLLTGGWKGSPVVFHETWLITGSHRQAAVRQVYPDIPSLAIPVITLSEVFEEAGLDLDEVMMNEGSQEPWDSGFVFALNALPTSLLDKYGIQF